jgi:hypothetical protein
LDAGTHKTSSRATSKRTPYSKWRCRSGLTASAVARTVVWSGTAASY